MTKFPTLVEQFTKSSALRGMEPWLPRNDVWLPEWQDFDIEYRKTRVGKCIGKMPESYHAYCDKLQSNMDLLKIRLREDYDKQRLAGLDESFLATQAADWVTIMVDAVLNWAGQSIEDPRGDHVDAAEFKRFVVVVWDFYEKFTTAYNKVVRKVRHELQEKTDPRPLVTFSPTRIWGPHTINADKMCKLIGTRVGVVSLPSVFAKFPLLWAPLAHEVFGHDISHALGRTTSAHLMPKIIKDFEKIVAANVSAEWRPTWLTWTEELAADLAGLLCMGPYFAISFAALMSVSACSDPFAPLWRPGRVGTTLVARTGRAYDEHPPDLLRLYALLGAAEAMLGLQGFDEMSRSVEALKQVVDEACLSSCMIDVYDFDSQSVLMRYDCDDLVTNARNIGASIVTTPLESLANRPITDFHSWNNADEAKATTIAAKAKEFAVSKAKEIVKFAGDLSQVPQLPDGVDSSHLLTGATMAVYDDPAAFDYINEFLSAALTERAKDKRFDSLQRP